MARIAGVNIPQNKLVLVGLTYIYGIGDKFSKKICKDLEKYSKYISSIKILSVYGGTNIETQIKSLNKGVHIVVGTPGRTKDLIKRKVLKLELVDKVVLDEADEMLSMGFADDVERIFGECPAGKAKGMGSSGGAPVPDDAFDLDELLGEASAIASIRRCPLDSGCLLYAVRHDRLKFERARRLLEMKEVIRDARKKADEVEDVD